MKIKWDRTPTGSLGDGIRGTWEILLEDGRLWKLTLYRSDLSERIFGRFDEYDDAVAYAERLDPRGN